MPAAFSMPEFQWRLSDNNPILPRERRQRAYQQIFQRLFGKVSSPSEVPRHEIDGGVQAPVLQVIPDPIADPCQAAQPTLRFRPFLTLET
jgi:hypothetical protein